MFDLQEQLTDFNIARDDQDDDNQDTDPEQGSQYDDDDQDIYNMIETVSKQGESNNLLRERGTVRWPAHLNVIPLNIVLVCILQIATTIIVTVSQHGEVHE